MSGARLRSQLLGAGLLGLLVLGMGAGGLRLWQAREVTRRLAAQLAGVQGVAAQAAAEEARLQEAVARKAPDLAEMLEVFFPEWEAAVSVEARPLGVSGLRHVRAQMTVAGVVWADLRRLIELAESQTPPWRLTGVALEAGLEGLAGELSWEAVERE